MITFQLQYFNFEGFFGTVHFRMKTFSWKSRRSSWWFKNHFMTQNHLSWSNRKVLQNFHCLYFKIKLWIFLSKDGNEIGFTLLAENFKSKSVNLRIWINIFCNSLIFMWHKSHDYTPCDMKLKHDYSWFLEMLDKLF